MDKLSKEEFYLIVNKATKLASINIEDLLSNCKIECKSEDKLYNWYLQNEHDFLNNGLLYHTFKKEYMNNCRFKREYHVPDYVALPFARHYILTHREDNAGKNELIQSRHENEDYYKYFLTVQHYDDYLNVLIKLMPMCYNPYHYFKSDIVHRLMCELIDQELPSFGFTVKPAL